jgi:DnaJ-class molecular chaperone
VIDGAYRRLAAKYHPDKDPSDSATTRMVEINAAYEILKNPGKRAEYDRERARAERDRREAETREAESATSLPAASPVASHELAAEVSNSVFKKVLWAAAVVALLVYFPWGIALLGAAWGGVWVVKRHPGAVAKVLKLSLSIAVALGVYLWARQRRLNEQREKTERELADLDIQDLLRKELRETSGRVA